MSVVFNSIGLLLVRIPLGLVFIFAGMFKFSREGGVDGFVANMYPTAAQFMGGNEDLAILYMSAIPYAEIVLGSTIILGLLTRASAAMYAAMLVSFIIAAHPNEWLILTAPEGGLPEGIKYAPYIDYRTVYTALAAMLFFTGPGRLSVDGLFGQVIFAKKTIEHEEV